MNKPLTYLSRVSSTVKNNFPGVLLAAPPKSTTQPAAVIEVLSSPYVVVSSNEKVVSVPFANWQDILKGNVIYSGPMSTVYKAQWRNTDIALKLVKGGSHVEESDDRFVSRS
jgi:hypothetical protein